MSTDTTVSPLRQRMIEAMAAHSLNRHTQRSHIRACKRFAAGWSSPDTAMPDEVRRFQLHLIESGSSICNRNPGVRFLFRATLRRHDSQLPVRNCAGVLSAEACAGTGSAARPRSRNCADGGLGRKGHDDARGWRLRRRAWRGPLGR